MQIPVVVPEPVAAPAEEAAPPETIEVEVPAVEEEPAPEELPAETAPEPEEMSPADQVMDLLSRADAAYAAWEFEKAEPLYGRLSEMPEMLTDEQIDLVQRRLADIAIWRRAEQLREAGDFAGAARELSKLSGE